MTHSNVRSAGLSRRFRHHGIERLLALPGARVGDFRLTAEGVFVTVRLRRRRLVCSGCGQVYRGMHDRAFRRWRHLDLAGRRCFIEYQLRRVWCRDCGVRVEAVPWARPGAGWETVGRIVERVVSDHLDERRLAGLVRIGCDELSYRRGQRYVTNVADHQTGRIVWSSPGRNAQTLQDFFDLLG